MLLHRRLWEDIRPAHQQGVHYAASLKMQQRTTPHGSHAAWMPMLNSEKKSRVLRDETARSAPQKCQRCAFATRKSRNT